MSRVGDLYLDAEDELKDELRRTPTKTEIETRAQALSKREATRFRLQIEKKVEEQEYAWP